MQLNKLAAATTLLVVFSIPQFTNAAPMLLTVKGIVGEVTGDPELIPADWLGALLLVEATWRYDSDNAGSDSFPEAGVAGYGYETLGSDGIGSDIHPANWITSSLSIFPAVGILPPVNFSESAFLAGSAAHDDFIRIRDLHGTLDPLPSDSFWIQAYIDRDESPERFLSSASIRSDVANLIDSLSVDQELSLLFSGSDSNAFGTFSLRNENFDALNVSYYLTSWKLDNLDTVDEEPTDVPEPESFAILGLGLLGLSLARRSKPQN